MNIQYNEDKYNVKQQLICDETLCCSSFNTFLHYIPHCFSQVFKTHEHFRNP